MDLCRGFPILRQPQHILLGYTKASTEAATLADCLDLCFGDFQRGGGCRSVMFFYEERRDNCVLNTETELTAAHFFVEEADTFVDYASFEPCLGQEQVRHAAVVGARAGDDRLQKSEQRAAKARGLHLRTPPQVARRHFLDPRRVSAPSRSSPPRPLTSTDPPHFRVRPSRAPRPPRPPGRPSRAPRRRPTSRWAARRGS